MKFWGYKLKDGTIKSRRYFNYGDINEAVESDFVELVMEPFEASGWYQAEQQIAEYFKEDK